MTCVECGSSTFYVDVTHKGVENECTNCGHIEVHKITVDMVPRGAHVAPFAFIPCSNTLAKVSEDAST